MIDKTTNYSNDCLYECKELMREHVLNSCLDINCDDICSALYEEIDIDKFKAWFDRNVNTFKSKQNIQTYFKRAFLTELNRKTFELKVEAVNSQFLIEALRDKGIKILADDTCYIDVMWTYVHKLGCPIEMIQDLNHKIVDYMKEGQTFKDYLDLVKKSKALKPYSIDWKHVEEQYLTELAKWNAVLDEMYITGVENYDR